MALKFPDKDPDEKLDYTVDWSRYLGDLTISSVQWKITKSDGTLLDWDIGEVFEDDVITTGSASASVNGATSSSTSVTVDGVSGTIRVGHVVTGTGVASGTSVTAVDGATVTLSKSATLADDTELTFTAIGLTNANAVNTNTTATIVLDKGVTNTTYRIFCEITTSTSTKTSAAIVTQREIVLRVRGRP